MLKLLFQAGVKAITKAFRRDKDGTALRVMHHFKRNEGAIRGGAEDGSGMGSGGMHHGHGRGKGHGKHGSRGTHAWQAGGPAGKMQDYLLEDTRDITKRKNDEMLRNKRRKLNKVRKYAISLDISDAPGHWDAKYGKWLPSPLPGTKGSVAAIGNKNSSMTKRSSDEYGDPTNSMVTLDDKYDDA